MAHQFKKEGRSVLLAAADTFRAAAIEQLAVWGQRVDVPLIKQQIDADPAAVVLMPSRRRNPERPISSLLIRQGGCTPRSIWWRNWKKSNASWFEKSRVHPMKSCCYWCHDRSECVNQAKMFNEEIGVRESSWPKWTAHRKRHCFRIASELHIPIRYIGIGETVDDLRPFKSDDFINALFDQRDADHQKWIQINKRCNGDQLSIMIGRSVISTIADAQSRRRFAMDPETCENLSERINFLLHNCFSMRIWSGLRNGKDSRSDRTGQHHQLYSFYGSHVFVLLQHPVYEEKILAKAHPEPCLGTNWPAGGTNPISNLT